MRQDQPSSYKTKACRSYARTGRCPYGPRCRFMHGDVVEAQHLAALRLADEQPFVSNDVRVLEGALPSTAAQPFTSTGRVAEQQPPQPLPPQAQLPMQLPREPLMYASALPQPALPTQASPSHRHLQSQSTCIAYGPLQPQILPLGAQSLAPAPASSVPDTPHRQPPQTPLSHLPHQLHSSPLAPPHQSPFAPMTFRRGSSDESGMDEEVQRESSSLPSPRSRPSLPLTPPHAPAPSTSTVMLAELGNGSVRPLAREHGAGPATPGAVLLPYAQLPHGDGLKAPAHEFTSHVCATMQGLGFSQQRMAGSLCTQPLAASPPSATPSAITSPGSSLLASAVPSAIPSARSSERPSPALLPLPLGTLPGAALPPGFLPPAALGAAPAAATSSGLDLPLLSALPAGSGAFREGACDTSISSAIAARASSAATSTAAEASIALSRASGESSSRDSSSTELGGATVRGSLSGLPSSFEARLDAIDAEGDGAVTPGERAYSSFTRSSLAKQLSVLFDDAPANAEGAADITAVAAEPSKGADDQMQLAISDYTTAMLADQLAALCCSPPRQGRASAGASSPTS